MQCVSFIRIRLTLKCNCIYQTNIPHGNVSHALHDFSSDNSGSTIVSRYLDSLRPHLQRFHGLQPNDVIEAMKNARDAHNDGFGIVNQDRIRGESNVTIADCLKHSNHLTSLKNAHTLNRVHVEEVGRA